MDEYRRALEKLSPEARKFVEYFVDEFIPAVRVLSAAAGRRFFGPLTEGFQLLEARVSQLEPLFESTGGILGRLSKSFFELFFSAENFGRTEKIWEINDRLLGRLGDTVLNLVDGLLELLVAAEPVIDAFGRWALSTSTGWLKEVKDDTAGVTSEFKEALETAGRIFGIFGILGDGLGSVFRSAQGEGNAIDIFLTDLENKVTAFRDSAAEAEADGSLSTYLNDATTNGLIFLDAIGEIIGALGDIADDEGTGQFLQSLKDIAIDIRAALPAFTEEDGTLAKFGTFLERITDLFIALNDSGAFETFFDTLNDILEGIVQFVEDNEEVINFFAKIAAFGLALGLIYRPIKFLGDAFVGLANLLLGNVVVRGFMGKGPMAFLARLFGTAAVGATGARAAAGIGGAAAAGGFIGQGINKVKDFFAPNTKGATSRALGRGATQFAKPALGFAAKAGLRAGITAASGPAAPIVGAAMLAWTAYDLIKMVGDNTKAEAEQSWSGSTSWYDSEAKPWFNSKPAEVKQSTMGTWDFLGKTDPSANFAQTSSWYNASATPWLANKPGEARTATSGFYNWLGADGELRPQWNAATGTYSSTISPWLAKKPGEANAATAGFYSWAGNIGPEFANTPQFFNQVMLPYFINLTRTMQLLGKLMWRGLLGELPTVVAYIVAALNVLAAALNPFISLYNSVRGLSGQSGRINSLPTLSANVPRLARGGVVMPQSGGMLAIIGEGGKRERVEPLDPDGLSKRDKAIIDRLSGGGATINVYPSEGMNEQELAKKVSRELAYQLRRGTV